jgi:glycerol kinase
MQYVMALDQGTTSSRAILFDKCGNIAAMAQQEFPQLYPREGWVEHDPRDILGSLVGVYAEAVVRAGISPADIAALGIANQRETTIVWERATGKPVYNAIVWQCRRTADFCEKLKADSVGKLIYQKTGLVPDAYFSASKLQWILDNVSGARERAERGELLFGTVDTYVMWHLSKGTIFATDYTNAARTMLFNIHTLRWDEELLKLFHIPACMLPQVYPSGTRYGFTDESITGVKIPICGVAGDQQAALFGQLCINEGDVKNTYGTGCFLLMNTGKQAVQSQNGLITSLGACLSERPPYVLEGSVFNGGSVVQWLRDEVKMIADAAETEQLATAVPDTGGVYLVPAFTGLGAPYWNPDARGTICGLTRGSKKEHLVRAALESVAYQVNDVLCAMEKDAGMAVNALAVDGGASKNNFLMQFQADISHKTVVRPSVVETTALGAAYLAGLTVGYWKGIDDIKQNSMAAETFTPSLSEEKRTKWLNGWKQAVEKTMYRG